MKIFLSCFLFFNFIISIICVIPEWNLVKAGENLLPSQTNEYIYTVIERLFYGVYLNMTRRIYRENNLVNYTNHVYMSYNYEKIIEKDVPFDYIESYYLINGQYIICPKGSNLPYNLNTNEYLKIPGFEEKGIKEWDLKCYKHEKNDVAFLLVFFLINGNNNFFYTKYGEYSWGNVGDKLADELYDYKLENNNYYSGKEREYPIMLLMKKGKNLSLVGKAVVIKTDKTEPYREDNNMEEKIIYPIQKYAQAYYSTSTNSFYFITYNDIYDFISGYVSTTNTAITVNNYDWAEIKINNKTPFEFIEKEFEIEKMDIKLYNRFVYYKIKDKNNTQKIYHGIIDVKANKVIFNTNETINYLIPYTNLSILVITQTSAYKVCFYKKDNQCVEECSEGYKYDIDGNTCSSSSSCENGKVTFIPSGICINSCDETYYVKKDGKCGLCKDFNPNNNSYKLVNGTDCIEFDEESMEYFNKDLKLLKCKENYSLVDNKCIFGEKNCYELCEKGKCIDYSEDENNQKCTSCKDGYYLEKGNCKKFCSERYGISGKECIPCLDYNCESFEINTCNCKNCIIGFYFNSSKLCNKCNSSCLKCEGESNNCTECDNKYSFLFEHKCINCAINCSIKDSDNCKCKECNKGFFVKNFLCEACNTNCLSCEGNSENCTKCKNHYFLNDKNKCEECSPDCDNCINKNNICTSCKEGKYLTEEKKCANCNEKCKTCDSGIIGENDHCLSCYNDPNSKYKYFANINNNKTCVEDCEKIGKILSDDKTMCENKKGNDYLIWIFFAIIAILIIIIAICIIKKCFCDSNNSSYVEEISTDIDGKEFIIN